MMLLAELQRLLEEQLNPRKLLLKVQQLLIDEYTHVEVELTSTTPLSAAGHRCLSFTLEVKYFDLKPITVTLYQDEPPWRPDSNVWMITIKGHASTVQPVPWDGTAMSALTIFETINLYMKDGFTQVVKFVNSNLLTGEEEKWVFKILEDVVFKYFETGRLKKAVDVHVVVDKILDDKGLQDLETRYNSSIISSMKLHHDTDGRHEVYILANLE